MMLHEGQYSSQSPFPEGKPAGWREHLRSSLRLPIDLTILATAFYLSYLPEHPDLKLLSLVVGFQILVLQLSGARRFVWRRFNLEAVGPFFLSVLTMSFVMLVVNVFLAKQSFDLSPPVIFHDCLYAFLGLLVIRIQRRIQFEHSPEGIEKRKILEYEAVETVRSGLENRIRELGGQLGKARTRIGFLEDERKQLLRRLERDAKKGLRPKLVYKVHDGHRIIYLDDVKWVESAGVYVHIFAVDEKHLVRMSMHDLEESHLDPDEFIRIHRQAIVRVSEIEKIESTAKDKHAVVLRDGQQFAISREHWKDLKARLFP